MTVNLMCQAVIPMYTGLPTDVITNNWSFRDFSVNTDLATAADALNPLVQAFYDSIYATIPSYLMDPVPNWTARWYNRDDPPPRSPYILPLRSTGATANPSAIPTEAAAVLSFQGVRISGSPQARRRGRIYLGGLPPASISQSTSSTYPVFSPTFIANVVANAATLRDDVVAAGDYFWTVWSPTSNSYVQITDGWVDNSPDTQRRRSVEASSRTAW
jgi:hypothetical protein